MMIRSWLTTAALLVVFSSKGAAQETTFEWVPFGGAFVPTTELAEGAVDQTEVTISQKTGGVFGSRLVAWWSRVVGWEASLSYALSDGKLEDDGGQDLCSMQGTNCSANVWFASSRLLFRYAPQEYKGWYVFAGAGVTVSGHGGDLWERADATTDLGGVIGIGGAIDISRVFAVRIDAENYFYKFDPKLSNDEEIGTVTGLDRTQNDLVFTAGLVIRLAGM